MRKVYQSIALACRPLRQPASDKQRGGRIYFTQQHVGEIISAPIGTYHIDLAIRGTHLGREFNIPIGVTIRFDGGMVISRIKPDMRQLNKHIKSVVLDFDEKVTQFRKNER